MIHQSHFRCFNQTCLIVSSANIHHILLLSCYPFDWLVEFQIWDWVSFYIISLSVLGNFFVIILTNLPALKTMNDTHLSKSPLVYFCVKICFATFDHWIMLCIDPRVLQTSFIYLHWSWRGYCIIKWWISTKEGESFFTMKDKSYCCRRGDAGVEHNIKRLL